MNKEHCLACGGELTLLGYLGTRAHYRCVSCGLDSSGEVKPCLDDDDAFLAWEASRKEGLS